MNIVNKIRSFDIVVVIKLFLSMGLLLISSGLTGYGVYMENISEPNKALILGLGFVVFGLIITFSFRYFELLMLRTAKWYVPVGFMVIIASIWLLISPQYNSLVINDRSAIKSEITEQYVKMRNISTPYMNRSELYTNQVIPQMNNVVKKINIMIAEQESPRFGKKCGTLCQMLKKIEEEIGTSVGELSKIYNGSRNSPSVKLGKSLADIQYLISDSDMSTNELIADFNDVKNKIEAILPKLKHERNPKNTTNIIIGSLNNFQEKLKNRMNNDAISSTNRRYAKETLATLNPLIINFRDVVSQTDGHNNAINILMSKNTKFTFDVLKLNTPLVQKHIKNYMPMVIVAYLIDIIAFSVIFVSIFITVDNKERLRIVNMLIRLRSDKVFIEEEVDSILNNESINSRKIISIEDELVKMDVEKITKITKIEEKSFEEINLIRDSITKLQNECIDGIDDMNSKLNLQLGSDEVSKALNPSQQMARLTEQFNIAKNGVELRYDIEIKEKERKIAATENRFENQIKMIEKSHEDISKVKTKELNKTIELRVQRLSNFEDRLEKIKENINLEVVELKIIDENKGDKNEN